MLSLQHSLLKDIAGIILLAMIFADVIAEGRLDVSREKILPLDLEVKTFEKPYRSSPYRTGTRGVVWSREIGHDDEVVAIRLHVKVAVLQSAPAFEIVVNDENGEEIERLDSNSSPVQSGDFWTAMVPGSTAVIELVTIDDPKPIVVLVDGYAYTTKNAKPQATVGEDNKIEIYQAPVDIRDLSSPVARLVIMMPGGGAYCTGFLLTKDLLLTNQHCIKNNDEARSTIAEFKYENPNPHPGQYRAQKLEAVDEGLDYALVRMAGLPGGKFKQASIISEPNLADHAELFVIQHPEGKPKMVAIDNCQVEDIARTGVGGDITDFGHICDTMGGSSGSPVFFKQSKAVVGLHHLGYREGVDKPINQAVYFSKIFSDLKSRNSPVYYEIMTATTGN